MIEEDLQLVFANLYDLVKRSGYNFVSSLEKTSPLEFKCERLLICGMGGSGISGDYIKKIAGTTSVKRIELNKTYNLPNYVDNTWKAIVISYSGNTEETLNMLDQLVEMDVESVIISSNGKIKEMAKKAKLKYIEVPQGIQPRAAFPYLFGAIYGLVAKTLDFPDPNDEIKKKWITTSELKYSEYDEIAEGILGNFPIILHTGLLSCVGLRFRCQLNENSKISASCYDVPEFSHNGIVGFDGTNKNQSLIILRSMQEDDRAQIHLNFFEDQIENINSTYSLVLETRELIEELLCFTWIADYISIKLAEIQNIDPLGVPSIDKLKGFLEKN